MMPRGLAWGDGTVNRWKISNRLPLLEIIISQPLWSPLKGVSAGRVDALTVEVGKEQGKGNTNYRPR
jgi:hypothetical protein